MGDKIVVLGAGGHTRVVLSILSYDERFVVDGIADRGASTIGEEICGTRVKYSLDDIGEIYKSGVEYAAIAIGDNEQRRELYDRAIEAGFTVPTLIHPTAIVERDAVVGAGTVVCMGARVGTLVEVGENSIVNTGAIVDHECALGKDVFIAPGVSIAGRVKVEDGAFIGIGATVKEKITIGRGSVVGAGAVVVLDVPAGITVVGVPARAATVGQS